MSEFWGPLALGFGVLVSLVTFGYYFDNKITQEYRNRFLYILDVVFPLDEDTINNRNNWPAILIFIFDYIFHTKKETEQPAFWRSVCASIVLYVLISVCWLTLSPERVVAVYNIEFAKQDVTQVVLLAVAIFAFVAFVNGIGDFFSLWASRMFIGRMSILPKKGARAIILVLDLLVSVLIFCTGIVLGLAFSEILGVGHMDTFVKKFNDTFGGFFLEAGFLFAHSRPQYDVLGIIFYTTLMTSIWVWVFLIGLGLWRWLKFLRNVLDVHKHPLGSIMTLGAVPISFFVAAVGYVRMLLV